MPHKYGRKPPKNAPALQFAALRGALPAFPDTYDSITGWNGWEMLGNDEYGDCVSVSEATEERIVTDGKSYPTLNQVYTFYKTQNPNFPQQDNGMDIQTALEYLHTHGRVSDGVKVVAFAKVDHTNLDEVKAALATFKCVWLGVNVTDLNENQFPGTAWTPTGRVLGGHSIIATGYDPSTIKMETWASEAALANAFMVDGSGSRPGVEEAWVVVWPEHVAWLSTEARDALATAYKEITGRDIVFPDDPTPTPEPTPTPPTPTPTPEPSEEQELIDLFKHFVTRFERWLTNHGH